MTLALHDLVCSTADAQNAATQIWNVYLGGTSSTRPFGASVLDGVDLDIETTTGSQYYAAFVDQLDSLWSGASKKYYLTAVPQCKLCSTCPNTLPVPAMGAHLGPCWRVRNECHCAAPCSDNCTFLKFAACICFIRTLMARHWPHRNLVLLHVLFSHAADLVCPTVPHPRKQTGMHMQVFILMPIWGQCCQAAQALLTMSSSSFTTTLVNTEAVTVQLLAHTSSGKVHLY